MEDMDNMGEMEGFLPGAGIDVSSLPEASPSEVLEVEDGDTIAINPTLVRKSINGKEFVMYGYNDQIPGPMIKTPQGSTITIDVTNNIDMETTIHWHGLRLDNKSDGVPDVTQEGAIQIGETFRYTVAFPDEGIYWYHPHVREDIQQDLGLYGNMLVTPEDDDAYNPVNREEIIILDDLMLDDAGELIPYGSDDATHPLMGRFGNTMLVNGETDYSLNVTQGSVVRFYLTNVANTRTFNVHFDNPSDTGKISMKLIGSDVGRYEQEELIESLIIAPAERYIVEVLFTEAGTYVFHHKSPLASYKLGTVTVAESKAEPSFAEDFEDLRSYDDVIADIDAFRAEFGRPVDKVIHLSVEMQMDHSMMNTMEDEHDDDGIEWEDTMPMMNEMSSKENTQWKMIDEETGNENMDIEWTFEKGSVAKIRIVNDEDSDHPMQHPIHFHGQRFLVLSMDGVQNDNLVWKDTVLIPKGQQADLLFDMSNPGDWMFHCHIAEHLTNGMMGMLRVSE